MKNLLLVGAPVAAAVSLVAITGGILSGTGPDLPSPSQDGVRLAWDTYSSQQPVPGGSVRSATDPKVIRETTVELEVDDVDSTIREIEDIADGAGGYISSSGFSSDDTDGDGSPDPVATLTLRVPAEGYTEVLRKVRAAGADVTSEHGSSREVTEEYTDLEARLRNLQAREQRYLDLLGKADQIADILTVEDRLNAVRLEIEQTQGRMKLLDDQTDLATITVGMRERAPEVVGDQEPSWSREAWDNSWEKAGEILQDVGAVGIATGVAMVFVIPGALLIGLGGRILLVAARSRKVHEPQG